MSGILLSVTILTAASGLSSPLHDDAHDNLHRNARCELVTQGDVASALGYPVDRPKGEVRRFFTGSWDSSKVSTCTFRWHGPASGKSHHTLYVELHLPPFEPGYSPQFLKSVYGDSGMTSYSVSNLGDAALWTSRTGAHPYGFLNVFGTKKYRLIVWEEDIADDATAHRISKSLAMIALQRL